MLTTIQESVTVGRDGLIQLHARGLEYNSRISVVAVIEKEPDIVSQQETIKKCNLTPFFELAGHIDIDSEAINNFREESLI